MTKALSVRRPDAPVFQLKLFVCLDTAVVAQQILQAMSSKADCTRSQICVKHADDVDTKVTLQPHHITVCTVQHLDK